MAMELPTVVRHRIKRRSTALVLFVFVWLTIFVFFCVSVYSLFHFVTNYNQSDSRGESHNSTSLNAIVEEDLPPFEKLQQLLHNDHELHNYNLTGKFLTRFLAARDNDAISAYNLVKGYFSLRKEHPEFFMNTSTVVRTFSKRMFYFQRERSPSGHFIVYNKPSNWDYSKHSLIYAMSSMVPFVELETLSNVDSARLGPITLVDMKDFSLKQMYNARNSDTDLLFKLSEQSLPVKTGPVHIVNNNWVFSMLFKICTPFMSQQLIDLFTIHGSDYSSLYEVIPKHMLPAPLGGDVQLREYSEHELQEMDLMLKQLYEQFPVEVEPSAGHKSSIS